MSPRSAARCSSPIPASRSIGRRSENGWSGSLNPGDQRRSALNRRRRKAIVSLSHDADRIVEVHFGKFRRPRLRGVNTFPDFRRTEFIDQLFDESDHPDIVARHPAPRVGLDDQPPAIGPGWPITGAPVLDAIEPTRFEMV